MIERFKAILNEVVAMVSETQQDLGDAVKFTGEDIAKIAISIYLQETKGQSPVAVNKPYNSGFKKPYVSNNGNGNGERTFNNPNAATKKQVDALKKLYGSFQAVKDAAGVQSLYALSKRQASDLISEAIASKSN